LSCVTKGQAVRPQRELSVIDPSALPVAPASPCPIAHAPQWTFTGPPPTAPQISPTQLRVGVAINGSDPTNGFTVILKADHNILRPAGVDLTGTVIPGPVT